MAIEIVADIGSTHGNDSSYLRRAVDVCREQGVKLKCQLFGPETAVGGNVQLNDLLFVETVEYGRECGVEVFASVWRVEDYETVRAAGCESIKFAYSKRESPMLGAACYDFKRVYVSGSHLDVLLSIPSVCNLLCIPQYPVYGMLSFDWCFPPFDGFSDHTLGIEQTIDAIHEGARVIEKHVKFNGYHDCPDSRFAIDEKMLGQLAEAASEF